MLEKINISDLNLKFRDKEPRKIINHALSYSSLSVLTTNFGPYEVSILHLVKELGKNVPIIWIDTGFNTPETYEYVNDLINKLDLKVKKYSPRKNSIFKNFKINEIPHYDDPKHVDFTFEVKIEPFKRAMNEIKPEIWFTNIRKGQTEFRDNQDIFSFSKEGLLKVSPFYYWTDNRLDYYLKENNLKNNLRYFDPTKVLANRECGLHN